MGVVSTSSPSWADFQRLNDTNSESSTSAVNSDTQADTTVTPQNNSTDDSPVGVDTRYGDKIQNPELDKIPLYTPYVVSYDRKKTKDGLVESAAYLKRYYSMIDAEIYFSNEYVEDIVSIEWNIQQQTMPLFGYNSYTYDEVAQGGRIIFGTFTINFTSPNYLFKLLDSINEAEQTLLSNYIFQKHERIVDGVDQVVQNVNTRFDGTINYPNHAPIWSKTFDIDAVFGHKLDSYIEPVHILIEGVKIMNSNIAMSADGGGRPNIFETYSFVARDITTRDYKAPYDASKNSSDTATITSDNSSDTATSDTSQNNVTDGLKNTGGVVQKYYSMDDYTDRYSEFGGSYGDVIQLKRDLNIQGVDIYSIPSQSYPFSTIGEGPAIMMDRTDSQMMTTVDDDDEDTIAFYYEQKALIDDGDFVAAIKMDIDQTRELFGDKYNSQIISMLNYTEKLIAEGKIKQTKPYDIQALKGG